MGFDDLKGRIFIVKTAEASAKHSRCDIVTFHGSADKVEILCKRYTDGKYENGTISGGTGDDAYTIDVTEVGTNRQIDLKPGSPKGSGGKVGGSWTADDMPPGPANG
jgi:hypothetical protein